MRPKGQDISLADLIVLGGCTAIEKPRKTAVLTSKYPSHRADRHHGMNAEARVRPKQMASVTTRSRNTAFRPRNVDRAQLPP